MNKKALSLYNRSILKKNGGFFLDMNENKTRVCGHFPDGHLPSSFGRSGNSLKLFSIQVYCSLSPRPF